MREMPKGTEKINVLLNESSFICHTGKSIVFNFSDLPVDKQLIVINNLYCIFDLGPPWSHGTDEEWIPISKWGFIARKPTSQGRKRSAEKNQEVFPHVIDLLNTKQPFKWNRYAWEKISKNMRRKYILMTKTYTN